MQGPYISTRFKQQTAAVHPLSTPNDKVKPTFKDRLVRRWRQIFITFDHADAGHRDRYSVERALALREYCEKTSFARVLAVCVLTPFPALVTTLALDFIPLVNPSEGWKANYGFWIRLFWQIFFTCLGGVLQMKPMISPGAITGKGAILIAGGTASSFICLLLVVASNLGFPIPFCVVATVGPFVSLFLLFTVLVIGPRALASSPTLQQELKAHLPTMAVEGALVLIYPTFNALFTWVSATNQTILFCILTVINFTMKYVIACVSPHLDECLATIVVFSVEVFNSFYTSICMQTTTSPATIPFIFAVDIISLGAAVREIFLQTKVSPTTSESMASSKIVLENLPDQLREFFQGDRTRGSKAQLIRIYAPVPLHISNAIRELLEELGVTKCKEERSKCLTPKRSTSFQQLSCRSKSFMVTETIPKKRNSDIQNQAV